MQQAGERQDWARVHGVLKGTNLFCYRQLEDADTGKEPLFTIAINKVMGPLVVTPRGHHEVLGPQEGGHRPQRDRSLMLLTAPHPAAGPGMLRDHALRRQHHWKTVSLLLYQPQPLSVLREDSTTSFGFLILLPSSPSGSDLHLLHLFLVSSANPSPVIPCPVASLLTFLPAFMEIARDPRSQRSCLPPCLPPCLPHPAPLSLTEDHCHSPSPFLPFLPTLVSRMQRRGLGESPTSSSFRGRTTKPALSPC